MKKFVKKELEDYRILLRSIPCVFAGLFFISIVLMNLLANREIRLNLSWLALDCGFIVSWMSFLTMDTVTKRFGAKASTKLSILGVIINLAVCVILFLVTKIPGNWGESYNYDTDIVNKALDATFSGTWYVVIGSMIAFLTSAVVNNLINSAIGRMLKSNSFRAFALRSYVSTAIGQFIDNLVFALLVSHVFFGWSLLQCVTCAITGAVVELLAEVVFSPIGYKVCKRWEKDGVGKEYLDFCKGAKQQ